MSGKPSEEKSVPKSSLSRLPDPIGPSSSARLGISVAATPERPTQIAVQPHRASSDYEDFKDGITAQMSELRRSQQDTSWLSFEL